MACYKFDELNIGRTTVPKQFCFVQPHQEGKGLESFFIALIDNKGPEKVKMLKKLALSKAIWYNNRGPMWMN